jgi:hypothetical protein
MLLKPHMLASDGSLTVHAEIVTMHVHFSGSWQGPQPHNQLPCSMPCLMQHQHGYKPPWLQYNNTLLTNLSKP